MYILHEKDKTDPDHIDADPDPASQNDADPCGSGSATLPPALRGIHDPDPIEKLRNLTLMYIQGADDKLGQTLLKHLK